MTRGGVLVNRLVISEHYARDWRGFCWARAPQRFREQAVSVIHWSWFCCVELNQIRKEARGKGVNDTLLYLSMHQATSQLKLVLMLFWHSHSTTIHHCKGAAQNKNAHNIYSYVNKLIYWQILLAWHRNVFQFYSLNEGCECEECHFRGLLRVAQLSVVG